MRRAAVPLALLLMAAVVFFVTRDEPGPVPPAPEPSESASEPPAPSELVYAEGNQLFTYDLQTKQTTKGASLPTDDFDVSVDGQRWAATSGTPIKRDPDPSIQPTEIMVGEVDGTGSEAIGIGYSPVWSPDGTQVAAVVPADGYLICPLDVDPGKAQEDPKSEGCTEGERILFYDPDERTQGVTALGGGAWEILTWIGGDQILGVSAENGAVPIGEAGATGEPAKVPLRAEDIFAASPVELLVLAVTDGGAAIADTDANVVKSVGLSDIEHAAWSPDGRTIAVLGGGLALVDVDTGNVTPFLGTKSGSDLVWSADSSSVGYLSGGQTIVCEAGPITCEKHQLRGRKSLLAFR